MTDLEQAQPSSTQRVISYPGNSGQSAGESVVLPMERGNLAHRFERILRYLFERAPREVPLSPTTRHTANSDSTMCKQSIMLRSIQLMSSMRRESIKMETIESCLYFTVDTLVECTVKTSIPESDFEHAQKIQKGIGISCRVFFQAPCVHPFDVEVTLVPTTVSGHTPDVNFDKGINFQRSIIRIGTTSEECLNARLVSQRLIIKRSKDDVQEYEVFEVYGQQLLADNENGIGENFDLGAECVICLMSDRNTLLLPCRHMCICSDCADTLGKGDGKCPICRHDYASMITVGAHKQSVEMTSN